MTCYCFIVSDYVYIIESKKKTTEQGDVIMSIWKERK